MLKIFDFVTDEERRLINFSRRSSVSVPQIKSSSVVAFLTVLLFAVVGGGQTSPTGGGTVVRKSDGPSRTTLEDNSPLLHLKGKCGLYSVCDLATHFCDAVVNACVSCSDDCHPGRIAGDPYAIEDCRQKCRVKDELGLNESLKRIELLQAIETICIAVITLLLFVTSISLMLLRRLGSPSSSLPSYNSLEIDSKLT